VGQRFVNGTFLGFALVFSEVLLKLLAGLFGIDEKFAPRAEGEFADVAVRSAGSAADESDDLKLPVGHCAHDGRG